MSQMQEDIGTIINKGFGTWTRNLNICIPFVLNFVLNGLLMAVVSGVVLRGSEPIRPTFSNVL